MLDFVKTFIAGFIAITIIATILYFIFKIPGIQILCIFIPVIMLLGLLCLVVGHIILSFIEAIRSG